MMATALNTVENIVEKEEKGGYQHFLLSKSFQKPSFLDMYNNGINE